MKYWLTIFLSVLSLLSYSQNIVVLVTDSDGYANIRENPKADAKIVGTIKSGDFAYCGDCKDYWCKVHASHGQIEGYAHKSRFDPVQYLPDSVIQNLFTVIFREHTQHAKAVNLAYRKKDSISLAKAYKLYDEYSDARYEPILNILPSYFCRTRDTIVLNLFFDLLIADSGSASEQPDYILACCFVCFSDLVLLQLTKMPNKKQRSYIVGAIDFGLGNVFDLPENTSTKPEQKTPQKVAQFNALMNKLEEYRK